MTFGSILVALVAVRTTKLSFCAERSIPPSIFWTWALILQIACSFWTYTNAQDYVIRTERISYTLALGQSASINLVITPVPPSGLFSFGFSMPLESSEGQATNFTSLILPVALSHNGVLTTGAGVTVNSGLVSAKGTVNFFADALQPYSGSLLATAILTNLPAGTYTLRPTAYRTLGDRETLFVAGDGTVLDPTISFQSTTLKVDRSMELVGSLRLNYQSGLFEQHCRLRNTSSTTRSSFAIAVLDLPAGVQVWNAQESTNGIPIIRYNRPLAPEATVDLLVEFYVPDRRALVQPSYVVSFPDKSTVSDVKGTLLAIDRQVRLLDGTFAIEFLTEPNRVYHVIYSNSLEPNAVWHTVFPPVIGTGGRVQWLDNGPPKTESSPTASGAPRYYRLLSP